MQRGDTTTSARYAGTPRTSQPPKYYIIDFGLSRQYSPGDTWPLEDVIKSGDKNGLQNPF